ncbi:S-layer homology domain-containing protein [Cohnella sp. OV330]|uniref:S-layer homology domain-containing protein n=1 Tax=Cohnella sp. OV330 TaxID=1855288 RepID=UPI0008E3537A|nr:S-layer homology domain-containing protein [Cohnella sp. OV330]SFB36442.1 S-layer homology domain-containing protein [Cohnella sp. OV330]
MKKSYKSLFVLLAVMLFSLTASGSAFAFNDIQKDAGKSYIEQLQKKGLIKGDGGGMFKPKSALTAQSAVLLIVNGFGLNIDNIRFIKEPKASDFYTKVKDDAYYAKAFIVANLNGLEIPRDIDPNGKVTREQFAHWIFKAISKKGEYAWIEMYQTFKDEDKVTKGYMDSVQKLLIGKIATLDNGKFRPKNAITRSEAAVILAKALSFVKNTQPVPPAQPEQPVSPLTEVKLTSEAYGSEALKVTVSAQAPHPGYGIEIANVAFKDKQAIVTYRILKPDPAALYPQVITTVKASVYVSNAYTPVLGGEAQ